MGVMSESQSILDWQSALHDFLPGQQIRAISLGNRGGFSGASIWRVEAGSREFCLKAWPQSTKESSHLVRMHGWMKTARRAGLTFVPRVNAAGGGETWVRVSDRFWDLTDWMPGAADFHQHPSLERLAAAGVALAQVHESWYSHRSKGICPSIERRLEAIANWNRLAALEGSRSAALILEPEWIELLARAGERLAFWSPRLEVMLSGWRQKPVALQPCIGDIWHDHILFQRDAVSGIIDFGSARIDHPATDVGRLFGSLNADDDSSWASALVGYRSVQPFSWEDESLARLLDRTGVIVSLINWSRWIGRGERTFQDPVAVTRRLRSLVERVEGWKGPSGIVKE
jgi:Ser/Thr protein kinase RdoA (MazF antagonist)